MWFACDVARQRDKKAGIWDAVLHDYEGLYGVELSMTKAERLVARESALTHAMCLTGVDLVDGVPRRWRVENSWGDKPGDKGFHTMSDSWFDEYVFEVVVRASRLPEEVRRRPWRPSPSCCQLGPDGLSIPSIGAGSPAPAPRHVGLTASDVPGRLWSSFGIFSPVVSRGP